MDERTRARGHARLRAHEHGRVVCAHSIFFELRRKGVAGHRPRALLVWGVPHQLLFWMESGARGPLEAREARARSLSQLVMATDDPASLLESQRNVLLMASVHRNTRGTYDVCIGSY